MKIIMPLDFKSKIIPSKNEDLQNATSVGLGTLEEFEVVLISLVNDLNDKFNISEIVYENKLPGLVETNTYFGVICDDKGKLISYLSVVPMFLGGRNAFLSQQLIPGFTEVVKNSLNSSHNYFTNLPIYVVNFSFEFTAAMALNVFMADILDIKYVDFFNRSVKYPLGIDESTEYKTSIENIDELITKMAKKKSNEYFSIDYENNTIRFKEDRLISPNPLTNQPYWYLIKAYPILLVSIENGFNVDLSELMDNPEISSNKSMEVFIQYAQKISTPKEAIYQKIYYGAPGTGKSFNVDKITKQHPKDQIFRTTFYPDYTYSDFTGQLLPTVDRAKNEITYSFIKGVFTKSIVKAYEDLNKDVYLILEEMSRGDCAAIFGDIFQLLDRHLIGKNKGFSKYPINNEVIVQDVLQINDEKLILPPNLYILGTVNTSDQNVFVMDTAFKRRFDWKYVTTTALQQDGKILNDIMFKLYGLNGAVIETTWSKFYQALNKFITDKNYLSLSEDKQLGQFFIEFPNYLTEEDVKNKLQNKLLNYLWNDVHLNSYKSGISLFDNSISSFSNLYENFESDKTIFSDYFLTLLRDF